MAHSATQWTNSWFSLGFTTHFSKKKHLWRYSCAMFQLLWGSPMMEMLGMTVLKYFRCSGTLGVFRLAEIAHHIAGPCVAGMDDPWMMKDGPLDFLRWYLHESVCDSLGKWLFNYDPLHKFYTSSLFGVISRSTWHDEFFCGILCGMSFTLGSMHPFALGQVT